MNLDEITPLLLTYNEEANLDETLSSLSWAKQIIIVDSGSTDGTLAIAKQVPQATVFYRKFDHFAQQCNYGLSKVDTNWTLSLDADYKCPPQFVTELTSLQTSAFAGFRAGFIYCVFNRPLKASLYPPRVVLYQTQRARYERDGHAHRVNIDGPVGSLNSRLLHDDHKPLDVWFASQIKYARLEADKLAEQSRRLSWKDRIRSKIILAPWLTAIYCLIWRGLWRDGRAGWYYCSQRVLAELILSLTLLDKRLR